MNRFRLMFIVAAWLAMTVADTNAQRVDTSFVEVHGHRIALYLSGTGGPTVVMEAGGGSWHRDWVDVVPQLYGATRVVTYDRPGFGLSQLCDEPRTADRVSHELRTALEHSGIDGPYVLVGWSLGGAFSRVFAGNFPELVSGLVLVDPAPEAFYSRIAAEFPNEWSREVVGHFSAVYGDSTRRAEQLELAAYESSMAQARASDDRHRTPTIVLIAGRDEELSDPISRVWVRELTRWAAARPNTTSKVVPRSGHHIPRQVPTAVIEAVQELVARARR